MLTSVMLFFSHEWKKKIDQVLATPPASVNRFPRRAGIGAVAMSVNKALSASLPLFLPRSSSLSSPFFPANVFPEPVAWQRRRFPEI